MASVKVPNGGHGQTYVKFGWLVSFASRLQFNIACSTGCYHALAFVTVSAPDGSGVWVEAQMQLRVAHDRRSIAFLFQHFFV